MAKRGIELVIDQTLTTSWNNLGGEIDCKNVSRATLDSIGLYSDIEINDSENLRFRAVAKIEDIGSDIYQLSIESPTMQGVIITDDYVELYEDIDQKRLFQTKIENIIPIIQFQVMCETITAATPGVIKSAYYTKGMK